jgi:hypothetical protein
MFLLGAIGYLVTDWGDHGHWQQLPISFFGFVAGSGFGWNVSIPLSPLLPYHVATIFFIVKFLTKFRREFGYSQIRWYKKNRRDTGFACIQE